MSKIDELEQQIERLKSSVEELILLNDLALAASSSLDVDQMLDPIVQKSIKAIKAEQGSILLVTEKQDDPLKTLIRHQDFSGSMQSYKIGTHVTGWVLKYRKPLMIENLAEDERFHVTEQEAKDIHSVLWLPILSQAKIIGILVMTNKKTGEPFSNNDLRLLSIIAAQSGQLIRNSQLQQEAIDKKRLEQELILAQNIQRVCFLRRIPKQRASKLPAILVRLKLSVAITMTILRSIKITLGLSLPMFPVMAPPRR